MKTEFVFKTATDGGTSIEIEGKEFLKALNDKNEVLSFIEMTRAYGAMYMIKHHYQNHPYCFVTPEVYKEVANHVDNDDTVVIEPKIDVLEGKEGKEDFFHLMICVRNREGNTVYRKPSNEAVYTDCKEWFEKLFGTEAIVKKNPNINT